MKRALLQLHFAVLLAGFTGVLGRLIHLNEGLLVWFRLLITSIILWVLFGFSKRLQRVSRADLFRLSAVGFIAALHWLSFYGSIKYSNVSIALVCFSSIGFFTAIAEPLIAKTRMDRMELFLGLLTLVGIYVIFHFDSQYKTGIIFGLISAVLATLFPIYNRLLLQRINMETLLTYQQTAGLLSLSVLLPFYLRFFPADYFIPTWSDFGWLMVLSVFCSVIAFQFSFHALKRLSAFTVNLTYNLEPIYGILLAFLIYHENKYLSNWFYAGFGIIAIALLIHLYRIMRTEKKLLADAR